MVEWTGGVNEMFSVNITDDELVKLKDSGGEIQHEKVIQICLPQYGDDHQTHVPTEKRALNLKYLVLQLSHSQPYVIM